VPPLLRRERSVGERVEREEHSAPSPTSIIAQATLETAVGEFRAALSCLCTSEELAESEKSVLKIERLWREAGAEQAVLAALARPAVINGFVEILFNSVSAQVLQVAVFLLAELASRDDAVVQTLTRVDSDVDCLVALFKKGLVEAVVLICLLAPTPEQLVEMDMAEALVSTIRRGDEDPLRMCINPKAASVILLARSSPRRAAAARTGTGTAPRRRCQGPRSCRRGSSGAWPRAWEPSRCWTRGWPPCASCSDASGRTATAGAASPRGIGASFAGPTGVEALFGPSFLAGQLLKSNVGALFSRPGWRCSKVGWDGFIPL